MKDFTPALTPPQGGELEKSSDFERIALKIAAKHFFLPFPIRKGAGGWVKTIVNSIKKQDAIALRGFTKGVSQAGVAWLAAFALCTGLGFYRRLRK